MKLTENQVEQLKEALCYALAWNYEYKRINNLSGGNPYWVEMAEKAVAIREETR